MVKERWVVAERTIDFKVQKVFNKEKYKCSFDKIIYKMFRDKVQARPYH